MSVVKIGLNFTQLTNLTLPDLSINSTLTELLPQMYENANTGTNHWITIIILIALSTVFYVMLSDRTPLTNFGYNNLRAMGLSFGIASMIGVYGVMLGIYSNYRSVAIFMILYMLIYVYYLFVENKE